MTMAKLQDVNTTDVADAIRLGCRTMQSVFNADDNDIPFFASQVLPEAFLGFQSSYNEAHVPGRHLNALLSAQDALGLEPGEEAIEKHTRAAFFAFSGPAPFPLNRDYIGGPLVNFLDHNLREGFHALYALVKYRQDERARKLAENCIEAVFEYWHPERGWDKPRLEAMGLKVHSWTFVSGPARSIGPLVKYYRATGYGRALELALMLAEKATTEFFRDGGDFDPVLFGGHTHSTTCTMSSLAQLADLLGDARLMQRVKAFYDNGLWKIRDELGWVAENVRMHENPPDQGEVNNTGDIVETALILGRWGHPDCFHDAERIVRGHLLPSQLRDVSFISEPPNPNNEDGKRNVADRHRGAFGFPAPYGHQPVGAKAVSFNMDIVGGAVGSLCEVWREAVRTDASGHHVNLLFDRETDALKVESPYTHGPLEVTVKRPAPLWVRMPPWVDRTAMRVTGLEQQPRVFGAYAFAPAPPVGRPLTFAFAMPEQTITMRHRTHDIRVRLRGDEVVAMDNFGADLTYFDPFE